MSDHTARAAERGPAPRREQVRRRVIAEGYARVEDLARAFDVSIMTVHRDLDVLELEGWLVKIRGGATANPAALVDAGVSERAASMSQEKAAIAAEAASLVSHGQTIFLDDSTTALALVPFLVTHPQLTVATNFLPAVAEIGTSAHVSLQVLGGEYHERQQSCQGLQTVAAIDRMQADLFFMSTTAVNNGQCLHRSEATVMVRQAFMRNSAHRVLLLDHAKFGRHSPHVLCDLGDFDTIVVDAGVDAQDLQQLHDVCDDVRVASVG